SVEAKRLDENQVTISVQDEGLGIDEKYRKDIFRKFYQAPLPKDSKIKKGSAGIGLAICKALIEAHNGKIWVESTVGSGSKFSFTIPRWLKDESKTGFGSR
ncbi:MAG: sensor histidine kinase, partial [Desulfomonilaceae bacterium]